ncbi:MAG: pyrroline-5-carboxylate reductase, partial [Candidatus Baltobacteraceae bacterium]
AEAARELGIPVDTDNARVVRQAEIVVLCAKPYQARAILESLAPEFGERHLVLSICAAVTLAELRAWAGPKPSVVRAMPNTPCLIGEGMTVLTAGPEVNAERVAAARRLFEPLGRTAVLDEDLMDGVTGLSGCGPAYGYLIIEALSEAGVKLGIPRSTATLLAAQTMLGAAKMVLERDVHPAALKDEVTTPAGCTIDGLMALEDGKLRSTLVAGVVAAAERSKSLRGNGKP